MSGFDNGKINGLYNFLYENQDYVKLIIANYFLLTVNDITIGFKGSDLSIVIYANILNFNNNNFNIIIVNRLDEYIYNFEDLDILNTFKNKIINNKRLFIFNKIIKK